MPSLPNRLRPVVLGVVMLVAVAPMTGATAAAQTDAEPAFVVDMRADGSATVSIRSTFDLATEADRQAFVMLENDEQAQADATARFLNRMRAVASDAQNATGREMRVADASMDLRRTADNETGVIVLSVTWEGLAAVSAETLAVTEPFASGFEPDRTFVLHAPDGYEVVRVTPAPDATRGATVSWDAGTDLTGFEVVLEPAPSPTPTTATETTRSGGQPGFGMFAAGLATLLAAAGSLLRRRDG